MLDIKQLQAFAAVAEERSFEKAAQKLYFTQSAVSQRIKGLEERLGQVLLIRTSPVRVTAAGQQVLRYYRQLSIMEGELLNELQGGDKQEYMRIALALNADSLDSWFTEAIAPVIESEKLLLDLDVDDQDETLSFLRSGEVAGCIASQSEPLAGCKSIPLGSMNYRFVATPAFLQRYFPKGVDADGFRQAPVVEFNDKDQLQNRYLEVFYGIDSNEYHRHRVPSSQAYIAFITEGLACGMIPDQHSQLIEEGVIVDMAPGNVLVIPLFWHVWNLHSVRIDKVTEQLVRASKKVLAPYQPE